MSAPQRHRAVLQRIAREAMLMRGLEPTFSEEAIQQANRLKAPATAEGVADLRALPWCSIDNDDSRDLDQLSVIDSSGSGPPRLLVAIADVDALVAKDSSLDQHARRNTTSVYTAAQVFPMLPFRLSTDLTSLNPGVDRLAIVVEMVLAGGEVVQSSIRRALVRNHAQLAYPSLGAWLEGRGELPGAAARVDGLAGIIRLQDEMAQSLRERRAEEAIIDLETIEAKAVFDDDMLVDLRDEEQDRAKQLIEELMIASNTVVARFLERHGFAALRRVVRSPERWERLVDLAADLGEDLPGDPDSAALERFLRRRREADPGTFPDLSLAVVKLMGRGEYVVQRPGSQPIGHFGLAVQDYAHSTAPNRRYPDLVAQRLLKAALAGTKSPYDVGELSDLAAHCTEQEGDAVKVERHVRKAAAALILAPRIGERFDAIVSSASDKGTWVRIFKPPIEGKLVQGAKGLRGGKRLTVRLVHVNPEAGHIDFVRA